MTNANKTEIICVIDRSGSMQSMMPEAQNSFNHFVEKQKELPGEVSITLAHFDNEYELVWNNIPIKEAKEYTLKPRNMTALLDALGKTINDVGGRLSKIPEEDRPARVIMVVLTDGCENASQEFKGQQIREMIDHQNKKYNWEFLYLGANQDAFAVGHGIGVQGGHTMSYQASGVGVRKAYAVANLAINNYVQAGVYGTGCVNNPHGLNINDINSDSGALKQAMDSFDTTGTKEPKKPEQPKSKSKTP